MRLIILLLIAACSAAAQTSYFPLDPGSRWIYQYNSRQVTGSYLTRRVIGTEERLGKTWTVIAIDGSPTRELYRAEDDGRIFTLTAAGERLSETLYLAPPSDGKPLTVTTTGFTSEQIVFTPGLGLTSRSSTLNTGSSGGFLESWRLLEARIGRTIRYQPEVSPGELTLGAESQRFDVTAKKARNCAVPCYFAACLLVPGADLPGAYKPCFEARVGVDAGDQDYLLFEFLGLRNEPIFSREFRLAGDERDWRRFVSVPLYSKPNEPFAPGEYRLRLTHATFDGIVRGTAETRIVIE